MLQDRWDSALLTLLWLHNHIGRVLGTMRLDWVVAWRQEVAACLPQGMVLIRHNMMKELRFQHTPTSMVPLPRAIRIDPTCQHKPLPSPEIPVIRRKDLQRRQMLQTSIA